MKAGDELGGNGCHWELMDGVGDEATEGWGHVLKESSFQCIISRCRRVTGHD